MDEYHVDMQDWHRWPKALIMRRVWSTNGHNRHREVRRYVPDGYAKEVEHKNANLRHMMEYYTDWAHDEVLKARRRENMERASADRLRERNHDIAADRERLKAENERLRELVAEMFGEHTHIYHANGMLAMGLSATSKQMAHWYDECTHWGIEVD